MLQVYIGDGAARRLYQSVKMDRQKASHSMNHGRMNLPLSSPKIPPPVEPAKTSAIQSLLPPSIVQDSRSVLLAARFFYFFLNARCDQTTKEKGIMNYT